MFAILPPQQPTTGSSGHPHYYRRPYRFYHCQFCSRRFTKSYNLMIHERSHFEMKKEYFCDICGKGGWSSREEVGGHRSTHSPGSISNSSSSSSSSSSSFYFY